MGNWELLYRHPLVSYERGEQHDRLDWLRVPEPQFLQGLLLQPPIRVIGFKILDFGVSASVEGF